jgi:hypothetical protein
MRDPIHRAASVIAAAASLLLAAACATTGPAVPTAPPTGGLGTPAAGSPGASGGPSATATVALTPVPGGVTDPPSPTPMSTTETEWGAIFDGLPAGFPVYPGALVADPIEGAASGAFSIGADAQTIATWYQAALERAGFSTETLSGPFEDGQIVIDSVGTPTTCRVQTTIRPLSGTTHVSVLYGADCPA